MCGEGEAKEVILDIHGTVLCAATHTNASAVRAMMPLSGANKGKAFLISRDLFKVERGRKQTLFFFNPLIFLPRLT